MANLMVKIREDMDVYDKDGDKVGSVDEIHLGDEDLTDNDLETGTAQKPTVARAPLVSSIVAAFSPPDSPPEEMRERLERYGFFKVDASLLGSDSYVMATQIASVDSDEERVNLTIDKDDLIEV